MVKPFQCCHRCIRNDPTLTLLKQHCLYHLLIHHLLGPHCHPRIHHHQQHRDPPPLRLPQVLLQVLQFTIALRYGEAQIGKCGFWLKGVQVDLYGHPDCLKSPLQGLLSTSALPYKAALILVIILVIQFPQGDLTAASLTVMVRCGVLIHNFLQSFHSLMIWISCQVWLLSRTHILGNFPPITRSYQDPGQGLVKPLQGYLSFFSSWIFG